MTTRRCRACKNMVSAESEVCPVCGRDHRTTAVAKAVKWAVVAGCAAGAVHWFVLRDAGGPVAAAGSDSTAAHVEAQTASASVHR